MGWAGLGSGAMAGYLQLKLRHYASALVADSNNLTVKMLLSGDLPNFKYSPYKLRNFHLVHPDLPGPPRKLDEWIA